MAVSFSISLLVSSEYKVDAVMTVAMSGSMILEEPF